MTKRKIKEDKSPLWVAWWDGDDSTDFFVFRSDEELFEFLGEDGIPTEEFADGLSLLKITGSERYLYTFPKAIHFLKKVE